MRNLMIVFLVLLFPTIVGTARDGEDQSPRLEFEVSSVRHNTSDDETKSRRAWQPRRFSATNTKLETLVLIAFGVPPNLARHLVIGGISAPRANCLRNCANRDEILTAHFDVEATLSKDIDASERGPILRRLLQERFRLKAHFEVRELPVYELVLDREDRLGPQLRRSDQDCLVWFQARYAARGAPIPSPSDAKGRPLCGVGQLSRIGDFVYVRRSAGDFSVLVQEIRGDLDLPIVDRTGLEGKFEWELTSEMPGLRELAPSNFAAKAPTLDIALREQLGLRLRRSTAALDVLVIESIAMPAPN